MLKNASKKRKGFTLVELIVVIAILLILSVAAVAAYSGFELSARKASLKSDASAFVSMMNTLNSSAITPIKAITNAVDADGGVQKKTAPDKVNALYFFFLPANKSTLGLPQELSLQIPLINDKHFKTDLSGVVKFAEQSRSTDTGKLVYWYVNEEYISKLKASDFSVTPASTSK
jgi:prepilin-type N-terminal cleavage/methylation domain-containing protein